jgi:ABC-2 type transport system ATP-binding protein
MIRFEHLSKRFGSKLAVDDLCLDVPRGEIFCFLGPNGAGKTTTIKMSTGLLRPTSGRVLVAGHDLQQDPLAAKKLLGYIPDHPFLYDKLSGREMLRFVAGLYSLPADGLDERCDAFLATFGIRHAADLLIEEFSHGMRQKLSFATCFLHDPQVVVVDEPWVGLDPHSMRRIKVYLRQRADDGVTLFMSTHTLSIAEEVADRVGILYRGKLLQVGTVAEIKALASNPGSLEDIFLELTRDDETETAA